MNIMPNVMKYFELKEDTKPAFKSDDLTNLQSLADDLQDIEETLVEDTQSLKESIPQGRFRDLLNAADDIARGKRKLIFALENLKSDIEANKENS